MIVGFDIRPLIFTRAGIRTYLYNLIINLAKEKDCRLHLFLSSSSRIAWQDISPNIVEEVIRLPHLNSLCERFWEGFLLPRAVAKRSIEVFHGTRFFVPNVSCPCVATIHDLAFKKYPAFVTRQAFRYFDAAVTLAAKRAKGVIVPSQATKLDVASLYGVAEDRISVVHEAAEEAFRRLADPQIPERTKKKFALKNKFILCTGTIEPRKNISGLVKAYQLLRTREPVDLVIAGGLGWLYTDVFATVKRLGLRGRVILAGYVPTEDLVHLYNACEVFVYPSFYEGFGLPVLEAMQCGAAVVASETLALREIFGDACYLVDPGSVESMAQGIQKVWDDDSLRSGLRRKSTEKAKHFSWEKTARETHAVYASVMGKSL